MLDEVLEEPPEAAVTKAFALKITFSNDEMRRDLLTNSIRVRVISPQVESLKDVLSSSPSSRTIIFGSVTALFFVVLASRTISRVTVPVAHNVRARCT